MKQKKIIGIFCYPVDDSTRAILRSDMDKIKEYEKKWSDICYLVVAFEISGEYYLPFNT